MSFPPAHFLHRSTTDGEEISNHVFQAWSVKTGDGEAQEKQPGDTITITADTTVTALWREAENGEITVTGYEPISTLECDYSSSYLSSYYYNLPTKVTVKLSNGNTVEGVLGSSWSVKEGKMGAGNTVTVRNTLDYLSGGNKYNNCINRSPLVDGYEVTMQIKFTAPENMLSIDWDTDKTYNWNEDVTVTVNNFKGSASDINLTKGYGSDMVTLTVATA